MDSRRLPYIDRTAAALVDQAGRVVGWTAAAEALLALNAAEVTGRPVRDLLAHPDQAVPRPEQIGAGWSGEAVLRTGRGEPMPVVYRTLPLSPERGDARYLLLAVAAERAGRWGQDHAFTRELFLQDSIGLAVFDDRLRLARTNTHLLPYSGLPADLKGRRLADFLLPQDAAALDGLLSEVLRTGRPAVRREVLVRTLDDARGGVVMAIDAFRLQSLDGSVIGVTALFNDVTEVHRSRARLDLLHRATTALGGSLSVTATAADLALVLVPGLGESATVHLADAVFTGDEPATDGTGVLLRHAAAVGTTDGASGAEPVRVPADLAAAISRDRTALAVPLRAGAALLGRVTVHRATGNPPYDRSDLQLLQEIAARAALALDNARRYTREHRAAVGLQRSLLPPAESATDAATTASVYLPTDTATGVGGDWFDVIPLSSARVALVAGDVVGHGLQASATMGRLRTAVRTLADLDLDPDELLVHLDDLVSRLVTEDDQDPGELGDPGDPGDQGEHGDGHGEPGRARPGSDPVGATCVYAVYDPVTGRCTVASAGHPPPAVVHPGGRAEYLPVNPGPPLGVGGLPFEATEVDLAPGSVLALYTDGLINRGTGDLDEGLAELLARLAATDLSGDLRAAGRAVAATPLPAGARSDDLTLLLARLREVPPGATAGWSVAPDPEAVAGVREAATARLREWGLDELAFTTELVLSELVTNAIRYAGGPVEVRLIRATALTCEVSDPSSTQPRMRRARVTDEGGRGLYLVAQLTDRWGSRYTRTGKTIWAEQAIPGAPGR